MTISHGVYTIVMTPSKRPVQNGGNLLAGPHDCWLVSPSPRDRCARERGDSSPDARRPQAPHASGTFSADNSVDRPFELHEGSVGGDSTGTRSAGRRRP